jgi:hypothetical protein
MRRLTHLGDAWVTIGAGLLVLVLADARVGLAMLLANALSHIPVQLLKREWRGRAPVMCWAGRSPWFRFPIRSHSRRDMPPR